MANSWLRLWHDMPNDPKWRTISRISGQSISLVQSVYIHLLVDASRNVTRGHANVTKEDLASALDVTEDQIELVLAAMQGRVLDGDYVSGWDKRQPKKEDAGDPESRAKSAAQRKREQREREKELIESQQCHAMSRNVTTDTDTDKNLNTLVPSPAGDDCPQQEILKLYAEHLPMLTQVKVWSEKRQKLLRTRWREDPKRQSLEWWGRFFRYVATSDFLTGKSTEWQADLEWLLTAGNFVKVIEGKYENKETA